MELNPNLGENPQVVSQPTETVVIPEVNTTAETISQPQTVIPDESLAEDTKIMGLSQEEINDPSAIVVTIADKTTPIVILYGPPACGKTMTLIRLTRWLHRNGYTVAPVGSFRPSSDTHYAKMCEDFPGMINSNEAANSTKNISFMLVRVLDKKGQTICQILEAPGEYYFNPNDPHEPNVAPPPYISEIKNNARRRIWCYMFEPNWKDQMQRDKYVQKIRNLQAVKKTSDYNIFLYNKVDKLPNAVLGAGLTNLKAVRNDLFNEYTGIQNHFIKEGVFDFIFGKSYNFTVVPFHTGDYSRRIAGGYTFTEGPDEYPRNLWNTIMKYVKG